MSMVTRGDAIRFLPEGMESDSVLVRKRRVDPLIISVCSSARVHPGFLRRRSNSSDVCWLKNLSVPGQQEQRQ